MTTATLQQLVHLRGQKVGRRAVIVGAEHVSFSAVATLAHGGASVAGLVTELPQHQSLRTFRAGAAVRYRAPVWTRTQVERDPRHREGRVGRAHRARLRPHADGRLRPGHLHRRLDSRPRAGGDGRLRARSRDARPAGRPRPPHDPARRVRGREPAASRRDGGRLRARRPPRGRGGRRLPARSGRVAVARPDHARRTPAGLGRPEPACSRRRTRRRATASCSARASSSRRARIQVRQDGRELWSGRVRRLVPGPLGAHPGRLDRRGRSSRGAP